MAPMDVLALHQNKFNRDLESKFIKVVRRLFLGHFWLLLMLATAFGLAKSYTKIDLSWV